jgi:hypothetical protein
VSIFFSHFIPVFLLLSSRLNGREDMKRNNHGLVQLTTGPPAVSHLQFKESSSETTTAIEPTITRPEATYPQTSSFNRDLNVSSTVQEDLEKSVRNNKF